MQRYIIRRLLLAVPTLLGLTLIVFFMVRATPGDTVTLILGEFGAGNREQRERLAQELKLSNNPLDWPGHYTTWIGRTVRGDMGDSIVSGRSVNEELLRRVPITAQLGAFSLFFAIIIGVPIGVYSAIRQNSRADFIGRSVAIGLLAMPNFAIALILIMVAGRWAHWAVPPATYPGLTEDPVANLKFMIVPALILGGATSGSLMRFTRTSMLEVMRQDYVRTAWSKGLHERAVVLRHALRNSLIPVVTLIGLQIPTLVGGSVIIESIYSIPGVARYYLFAINNHDYPVIQAVALLAALFVVVTNLIVDISYSWLDPRIRYT